MIRVEGLSKQFGTVKAVDEVSFQVQSGEVVGLLGPNGAGKTTSLRLICGYLEADQGRVFIDERNTSVEREKVREMIGYLPEYNPIYQDMLVYDYLQYIAEMRAIAPEDRLRRIQEMVRVCGLTEAVGKKISELSKGNRQRVGLAQAMIHDPKVLILDEPTSGLDPNQISEIRDLIKRLGQQKTVILSSHILSEIEATCDRVIIIHQGKVVADGNPKALQQEARDESRLHLKIAGGKSKNVLAGLQGLKGVSQAEAAENESDEIRGYLVRSSSKQDLRREIFQLSQAEGWVLYEMYREVVSLEDVFRRLTAKEGGKIQ